MPKPILEHIDIWQSAWPRNLAESVATLWPQAPWPQRAPREYYYIPISKVSVANVEFDPIKRESATMATPKNRFPFRTYSTKPFQGGVMEKVLQMNSYRQENGADFVLREFAICCAEGGGLNLRGNAIYLQ